MSEWVTTFTLEEESKKQGTTDESSIVKVTNLVRFIRAARTKKMVEFREDRVALVEKYREVLATHPPS